MFLKEPVDATPPLLVRAFTSVDIALILYIPGFIVSPRIKTSIDRNAPKVTLNSAPIYLLKTISLISFLKFSKVMPAAATGPMSGIKTSPSLVIVSLYSLL